MRWLLTLYPRAWRDRYGEAFEGIGSLLGSESGSSPKATRETRSNE